MAHLAPRLLLGEDLALCNSSGIKDLEQIARLKQTPLDVVVVINYLPTILILLIY